MNKQTIKSIKNKIMIIIAISLLFICGQTAFTFVNAVYASEEDPNEGEYIYLSDIDWMSQSKSGWKDLRKDGKDGVVNSYKDLSIKIEGSYYEFDHGIWAHATSNVYYDLSQFNGKYHYLKMYVGLNKTAATSSNGVRFRVYTSNADNLPSEKSDEWTQKENLNTKKLEMEAYCLPGQDAVFVKIDISDAKYLRLEANDNGENGNDHSVYVNPILITDNYKEKETAFQSIEEYDQQIKEYANKDLSDSNYEKLLLQRKFISNVGNYALEKFIEEDPANEETINWLMSDIENLRYYVLGGEPTGGYFNSLKVLTRLVKAHKDDFNDTTEISDEGKALLDQKQLNWPKTKGSLYKRMAITISLTHSADIYLWMQYNEVNKTDAVVRYEQFKEMYNKGMFKASDKADITPWFETYTIEEMRYVMHVMIDDEEVFWLNEYTQAKIDAEPDKAWNYLTPHSYMAYVDPNYTQDLYYVEENKDYFNDLFGVPQRDENGELIKDKDGNVVKKLLWDYDITRGTVDNKIQKLWMNFRNQFGTGAVCGGISKTGHCIRGVHAIPSAVIGQPGHAAIVYYSLNSDKTSPSYGKASWAIDNDVSGWPQSERSQRLPLGWGSDWSYRSTYNIPYIILAQEALNDYNNLVIAEEKLILIDIYKNDTAEQEKIYRDAIKTQSINFDAWYGLINLYLSDNTKTEEDYYNLAKEMMEALKCFPFTMNDLSNKIKPKFTSVGYQFNYSLLETKMLTEAKNYPNENSQVQQPGVTRNLASHLLGKINTELATFSFDGTDAGKIVLSDKFNGNGIRWDYNIDGIDSINKKESWKEVSFEAQEEHKLQLTADEIAKITAENDIYVHIVGVGYQEENLYKIDILESTGLPGDLYANDLENRVVGVNLTIEWRYNESDEWTSYSVGSPDLTGDKTVQLRQSATGTKLASEPVTFTFTEDNQSDERKYIKISYLSIEDYSTQSIDASRPFYAPNAIDGNINTLWHTDFRYNVITEGQKPFVIIKLSEPKYVSAVEFIQKQYKNNDPDYIKHLTVYISEDGDEWTEAGKIENCPKTIELRPIELDESVYGQYVKLEMDTYDMFASLAMVNLFEDITKLEHVNPTAGIGYSTTETTSEPVVARLVNPSTEIIITNNDGNDTYVFTENGEFTFEFKDKEGYTGSATAKVTWIDKSAPEVNVAYKLSDDQKLIAILDNINEDVYLLNDANKKTNFIEVEGDRIVRISFLDENEEVYKISELDDNKITEKITYKNTTGEVDRVAYYSIKFKKDENGKVTDVVENRVGLDSEGNTIELTQDEISILSKLETMRSNPLEFYLEEEQEYEFILQDKASNTTYKNVKVDYIENNTKILASDITYNTMTTTKNDVIATINPFLIDMNGKNYNVEILNNNKNSQYTFTENGEFTFRYAEASVDKEVREVKEHKAVVNWIDKIPPTAEVIYTPADKTNGEVIATLVNESEEIIITNNGSKKEYIFTENGEFTFEFQDKAGNKSSAKAEVTWIDKDIQEDNPTFNMIISAYNDNNETITSLNPNDEFKVISTLSEINNIEEGIKAILGKLKFDENNLELIDISLVDPDNFEIEYYEESGKVLVNTKGNTINENTDLFSISFKVKETATIGNTIIQITDLQAGTGKEIESNPIAFAQDVLLSINIEEKIVDDDDNKEDTLTLKPKAIEEHISIKDDYIILHDGITFEDFIELVDVSKEPEYHNKTISNNQNHFIKTGESISVGEKTWTFSIRGDIDGDGEITVNDLARAKLHFVNQIKLEGAYYQAANTDFDDEPATVNDIARIKLLLVGKISDLF